MVLSFEGFYAQVLGVMAGKPEFKYTVRPFTPEDITNQSHLQPCHKVVITLMHASIM